ncbi:hypothetical protein B0T10DRAFT_527466 [Thelonectria olida]|uniref:Uncharacterized protein n=1 Tax=Thelonectria olida TaxID=1576542 RepID=A0A9P8W8T3_9HYPO|nr:hypothetical protein B0T10DRAFT_527466 [Thelonectria olida]
MQLRLILSLLFLPITAVLAGGYADALERVWLYYAYPIDGLNDEADRTLGWKCKGWDPTNKNAEKTRKNEEQCDLLNTLGGASPQDKLAADKDGTLLGSEDTNPDPEETAKNVYAHYLKAKNPKVPDYLPYRFTKNGVTDYVTCINKVGYNEDNKWLFDRFNECTELIKTARVGDHGKWLIADAEDKLHSNGIAVQREPVGPGHSPIDSAVKWERTMEELQTITQGVKDKFYASGKALDHRTVIRAYESVDTKVKGC